MGADDADSEAAQSRGVLGAVSDADAATVFVEGGVEDVMDGFDAPVPAIECEGNCRTRPGRAAEGGGS